jgi:hypothetical protein
MNFKEMQNYVYRRTGHPDVTTTTPTTAIKNRVKQFINERQRELLTTEGVERLRQQVFTFASDTVNAEYAIPQTVTKILGIHERDNDYPLDYMPLHEYRLWSADPSAMEGTPTWYVDLGESAVAKQPSDNSELFYKSTSASDTGLVYLEVVTENNYQRVFTGAVLNGVTAVAANTAITDISHVTNFFLADTANGEVTLHEDSGAGTELANITEGHTRAHYRKVALIPKPSSAVTYYVDAEYSVNDLVQDTDESLLPKDFHYIVCQGALIDEYQKQEKERESKRSELAWFNGIKALKNYVGNNDDYIPVIGRMRKRGVSRLGPFYPADRFPFS